MGDAESNEAEDQGQAWSAQVEMMLEMADIIPIDVSQGTDVMMLLLRV